jgi:phage repressor protein C with HTH and peptisase S24 domain
MPDDTVGQRLTVLRARSGLSMEQLAKKMGYAGRSSVQRFFDEHLDDLGPVDAINLADALAGLGEPAITREEIINLSKYPLAEVRPNDTLAPRYMQLPRDVPVYGTAMGTYRSEEDGQDIEEAFIDRSEAIDHFARPPGYANRKGLYGLYVTGSSMQPRWESGDPLYVDPKRPPQIGDDVIVYLKRGAGGEQDQNDLEAVLLKRLVRMGANFVELEQYNPAFKFQIEKRRIEAIHRVIPQRELLAFH